MNGSKLLKVFVVAGVTAVSLVSTSQPGSAAPSLGTRQGVKYLNPASAAALHPNIPVTPLRFQSGDSTGAVSPHPKVIIDLWGSQWAHDYAGAGPALTRFFQGLYGPKDTWGTILNQYCEGVPAGTVYCNGQGIPIVHPKTPPLVAVYAHMNQPEPTNASYTDLQNEALRAARAMGLNSTTAQNTQIIIASGPGTHPDTFPSFFCAYHDSLSSPIGTIAWTNLPYLPDLGAGACTTLPDATLLDGYFSTETHEYAETATDFTVEPTALGWLASDGEEVADLCDNFDSRETLATGTYDVQGLWSNAADGCVTSG